jgi:hypothetical protein
MRLDAPQMAYVFSNECLVNKKSAWRDSKYTKT